MRSGGYRVHAAHALHSGIHGLLNCVCYDLLLLLLLKHELLLLLGKSGLLQLQLVVTSLLRRVYRTWLQLLSRWRRRSMGWWNGSSWHGLGRCLESRRCCAECSAYRAGFKGLKLSEDSLMNCLNSCPTFCTHPHF